MAVKGSCSCSSQTIVLMNGGMCRMINNEPVCTESVQDEALDVLTVMLYRMWMNEESVGQDGDSGRAA